MRRAAVLAYHFIHRFRNISENSAQVRLWSGHQVSWRAQPKRIFVIALWLQFIRDAIEKKTQELKKVSVRVKIISQNFDIDGPTSGYFCELNIIRQMENVRVPFSQKYG